jgi:hypothetical protein
MGRLCATIVDYYGMTGFENMPGNDAADRADAHKADTFHFITSRGFGRNDWKPAQLIVQPPET